LYISAINCPLWACGLSEYFADILGDRNTRNVTLAETVVILIFLCELLPTEGLGWRSG
jgi:hypothetical protein